MRRIVIPSLVGLAVLGVTACSPDEADFKDEGEEFINDSDEIEQAVGSDVSDAVCEEPTSKDVGTTYTCTATDAAAASYTFTVEITGDKELTVQEFAPTP